MSDWTELGKRIFADFVSRAGDAWEDYSADQKGVAKEVASDLSHLSLEYASGRIDKKDFDREMEHIGAQAAVLAAIAEKTGWNVMRELASNALTLAASALLGV